MPVRLATLDDTAAISQLFRAGIERWQRMDARGQVHDLDYEELSIYERWLHGGAWMSRETGAIWLSHLLRGAALPYVLDEDGILGYIELYPGREQSPFGDHVHIGQFVVQHNDEAVRDALLQFLFAEAQQAQRITISSSAYDQDAMALYKRYGMSIITQTQQLNIPAASGTVGFYKVTDHPNADPKQIEGWQMTIGRTQSAAYHWQHQWADLWQAVPQIQARRTHRQRFNVGGQDAFVCVQQQLYNVRSATVYCWTSKNLSSQLMAAIRDWTYKQGYRSLSLAVNDKITNTLGADVEKTPYEHVIFARDL